MARTILVTGGARSGKSALAERLALGLGTPVLYLATAEAGDAEMAERIARHRARRGADWTTAEEPFDLLSVLRARNPSRPALVDCLTFWLSNLMLAGQDWEGPVRDLAAALPGLPAPTVLVTNEVGTGIVPENALARRFRDAAGWMNQAVAAAADEVFLSVAGCPLRVKPYDPVP